MNDAIRKLKDVPYHLNTILEDLKNNSGNNGESANIKKYDITGTKWVKNSNGLYEYTINHNMSTDIVSIMVHTKNDNKAVDFSYTIIDNNNVKIIVAESLNVEVILVGVTKVETAREVDANNVLFSNENFSSTNVHDALLENKQSIENLKQFANSGKSRIASAIGTPLLESDTFEQMEKKINTLTSDFKNKLINKSVEVLDTDKLNILIDKIDEIKNSSTLPPGSIPEDKWIRCSNMITARDSFTSSIVDSKIYCIGGYNNNYVSVNECYDSKTDTWVTKTNMTTNRYGLTSGVVDNKIYCIGGFNGGYLKKNECYDTNTDTWTTKTTMPATRISLTSGVVDNKIYCIGGTNGNIYLSKNECYDPKTDTWSTKTNMPTARQGLTSSVVNDNIYCIGGYNGNYLNNNECYDPKTDAWSTKANMPTVRESLTSSVVNGKIYCIGGYNKTDKYLNKNECYNPEADTWTTKAGMTTARNRFISEAIDNRICCIGGYDAKQYLDVNECYIV